MPIHGEISRDPHPPVSDRKLGDEWEDWDGTPGADRTEAPAGLFLALVSGVAVVAAFLGSAVFWLAAPRLAGLGLRPLGLFLLGTWLVYLGLWLAALWLGVGGLQAGARLLRVLGGLRWSIGPAVVLGRALGLGRDRRGRRAPLRDVQRRRGIPTQLRHSPRPLKAPHPARRKRE